MRSYCFLCIVVLSGLFLSSCSDENVAATIVTDKLGLVMQADNSVGRLIIFNNGKMARPVNSARVSFDSVEVGKKFLFSYKELSHDSVPSIEVVKLEEAEHSPFNVQGGKTVSEVNELLNGNFTGSFYSFNADSSSVHNGLINVAFNSAESAYEYTVFAGENEISGSGTFSVEVNTDDQAMHLVFVHGVHPPESNLILDGDFLLATFENLVTIWQVGEEGGLKSYSFRK